MLPETFNSNIFLKMNIVFAGNSKHKVVIQSKISKWLERYFSEYKNFLLPIYTRIKIDDEVGLINIRVGNAVDDWELTSASPKKCLPFLGWL